MYNENRKQQFIDEKTKDVMLSNNIKSAFDNSEILEEQYGKDIAEWNSDQIIDFFKFFGSKSVQTLIQMHSALRDYANWCLSNGLLTDNQNHYNEITSSILYECMDKEKFESMIISRDRLLKEISCLPNESDKYLFLGLFEGIPMADCVICNLRFVDVNGNIVRLPNRDLRISDELVRIINRAAEEDCYISMGKNQRQYPYIPEDNGLIVRRYVWKKSVQNNKVMFVGNRIRKSAKYMGWDKGITIKNIIESGRIHFIKTYSSEHGIRPNEMIDNTKYRKIHENIFGVIQNNMMYKKIYGEFIDFS